MSELIGVESVRLGNRIPSLEGLGLDGDNAPKRFRRPHDKSWAHLARPGLQLAEVLSQGGESGALLSTRRSSFSPQWLGSAAGEQKVRQRGLEERGRAHVAKHRSHAESCCTAMAMADEGVAVLRVILNDHSDASGLSPRVSRHDLHRSQVSRHAAAASLETGAGLHLECPGQA